MDWFHIISSKLKVTSISFSFIRRYFDFVIKFFLKIRHKVWDVINVFCCHLTLLFVLTNSLNNGIMVGLINLMPHFLLHSVVLLEATFLFLNQLFEKYLNFQRFFICSSFGRQVCQNFGWAGLEPYVRSHITKPACCYVQLYGKTFYVFVYRIQCIPEENEGGFARKYGFERKTSI